MFFACFIQPVFFWLFWWLFRVVFQDWLFLDGFPTLFWLFQLTRFLTLSCFDFFESRDPGLAIWESFNSTPPLLEDAQTRELNNQGLLVVVLCHTPDEHPVHKLHETTEAPALGWRGVIYYGRWLRFCGVLLHQSSQSSSRSALQVQECNFGINSFDTPATFWGGWPGWQLCPQGWRKSALNI